MAGRGNNKDATTLCERSLAICEKALGLDHPDVAVGLNNLASLLAIVKSASTVLEVLNVRLHSIRATCLGVE